MPVETLKFYMRHFSDWLGLPSYALLLVAMIESSFDPDTGEFQNVRNWRTGATGLMQLRPIALADIKRAFGMSLDPYNPIQAIVGAALLFYLNRRYLRYYTKTEPDFRALLVAYNGGWTAGRYYMQNGFAPTAEGRNYLAKATNFASMVS